MARGILLRKSEITDVSYQFVNAFRIRVEVVETAGDMTPHIFLYRREPPNATTGEVIDYFMELCSAPDLADYPVGEPDPATEFPFFRLAYFELDLRASATVKEVWETVVREVNALAAALDRLDQLTPAIEVWTGTPPEGSSESSSTFAWLPLPGP